MIKDKKAYDASMRSERKRDMGGSYIYIFAAFFPLFLVFPITEGGNFGGNFACYIFAR